LAECTHPRRDPRRNKGTPKNGDLLNTQGTDNTHRVELEQKTLGFPEHLLQKNFTGDGTVKKVVYESSRHNAAVRGPPGTAPGESAEETLAGGLKTSTQKGGLTN